MSSRSRNVGTSHDPSLNFIPRQCTVSRGISIRVSVARPRRFVTRSRIVVPDEGFSVFRALISPAAIRAVREQQQRTANKKASRGYDLRFHEQSTTKINALGKLKARPNPVSEFTFVALRGHFELAHQFKCFVALTDLVHRQAA